MGTGSTCPGVSTDGGAGRAPRRIASNSSGSAEAPCARPLIRPARLPPGSEPPAPGGCGAIVSPNRASAVIGELGGIVGHRSTLLGRSVRAPCRGGSVMSEPVTSHSRRTMSPVGALFAAAATVALLDGLEAVIFFGLRGTPPMRIFQFVAGGLLGR